MNGQPVHTEAPKPIMSSQEFLEFGMNQIAYIKQVNIMEKSAYAVHAADGTLLSVIDTFDTAMMATRQNELIPVVVH